MRRSADAELRVNIGAGCGPAFHDSLHIWRGWIWTATWLQLDHVALASVEARRRDPDRFCDISLLFANAVQTLSKFMPPQRNGSRWLKGKNVQLLAYITGRWFDWLDRPHTNPREQGRYAQPAVCTGHYSQKRLIQFKTMSVLKNLHPWTRLVKEFGAECECYRQLSLCAFLPRLKQ